MGLRQLLGDPSHQRSLSHGRGYSNLSAQPVNDGKHLDLFPFSHRIPLLYTKHLATASLALDFLAAITALPTMPVPFGFSVGDCISACILIKDAIRALDSTRGSAAEYQEVIQELCDLDRALLEVANLAQTFETTAELNALSHTVGRTTEQCKACIEGFLGSIKGYGRALREGGSGSTIKDVKGKLGWALCGREHLTRFRAEINGHSSAVNMLLITASV